MLFRKPFVFVKAGTSLEIALVQYFKNNLDFSPN